MLVYSKEFENPHPFFESDVAEEGSHPAAVAYRYRRFPLGNHNIVVRTELHGLVKTKADESLYMTAYALNEWEKDEWRRKIDQQPGRSLLGHQGRLRVKHLSHTTGGDPVVWWQVPS